MIIATPRAFVDYALAYTRRGWRVFPLHSIRQGRCSCGRENCHSPGKHPRTKNGVKDATRQPEQVQQWWTTWPDANIGIATGQGLYVIDIDTTKGGTLEPSAPGGNDLRPLLAGSLAARTGSGGYHIYLSLDPALRLGNTAGTLGKGIDTRGEGGYVVAPPGHNQHGPYTWLGAQKELLPVPPALLTLLHVVSSLEEEPHEIETTTRKENSHDQLSRSTQAPATQKVQAYTDEQTGAHTVASISAAPAREARNNYLTSLAGVLRGRGMSAAEIRTLLLVANEARYGDGKHPQGPLTSDELERTILKSVARWEEKGGVLQPELPEVLLLRDLMNMTLVETPWIVPGLLSEGLTLLAGKPKVGKSWLILDLALTCARGTANGGGRVLGRYPVEAAGVFYLSLEDNAERLRKRVQKLLGSSSVPENFGYALRWKPLLLGGLQDLETCLLSEPNIRLVIIDTLARVRTPGPSNGSPYQEESTLMSKLQILANDHHIALVLVHHLRKMSSDDVFDEISGTLGLTGGADTSIVLKRQRNTNDGSLHLTGRDVEEQEYAMIFAPFTGHWTILGSVDERQLSRTQQDIVALLQQKGALTPADIANALGRQRGTIRSALSRMLQEKLVVKDAQGTYALPEKQEEQTNKDSNHQEDIPDPEEDEPAFEYPELAQEDASLEE